VCELFKISKLALLMVKYVQSIFFVFAKKMQFSTVGLRFLQLKNVQN